MPGVISFENLENAGMTIDNAIVYCRDMLWDAMLIACKECCNLNHQAIKL